MSEQILLVVLGGGQSLVRDGRGMVTGSSRDGNSLQV
jgi:hypothetical protein